MLKATEIASLSLPRSGRRGPVSAEESAYLDSVARELAEYGRILTQAMQPMIPQDTGTLSRSLRWEVHGKGTRQVALRVFVGNKDRPDVVVRSQLFGRRGFRARKGKVLRFEVGGRTVYARAVSGVLANDWFRKAWQKTEPQRQAMERRIGTFTSDKLIRVSDYPGAVLVSNPAQTKQPGMNRKRPARGKK